MTQSTQPCILVVDDDPRSRELMTVVLRHAGYAVTTAAHPTQAMTALDDSRPALALVDYHMPGVNGVEFCRWVRRQPGLAALRVVLLTGMDTEDVRVEARAAGVDDVVSKPFDRIELLARLKSLLESPVAR